jgi:hypothetical protein
VGSYSNFSQGCCRYPNFADSAASVKSHAHARLIPAPARAAVNRGDDRPVHPGEVGNRLVQIQRHLLEQIGEFTFRRRRE